jgi:hypothetical protein
VDITTGLERAVSQVRVTVNKVLPQAIAQRTFLGTLFISPHLSPPSTPTSPGNIEVFKGMQLKVLELGWCINLEGECMELGWWGQDQ